MPHPHPQDAPLNILYFSSIYIRVQKTQNASYAFHFFETYSDSTASQRLLIFSLGMSLNH